MHPRSAQEWVEDSITTRFQLQVEEGGDRLAVITPARRLTYIELDAEIRRVAAALHSAGVNRGDRVVIIMEQETWLIAAMLGVLRCAAIYVPIDPKWSMERGQAVMDDAQPSTVLADTANIFRAQLLQNDRHIEVINGELLAAERRPYTASGQSVSMIEPRADDPAYIYYTSGSTGPPKGVVDTHRNIIHNVRRYTENLEISPADRLTLLQTCGFSGAVSNVFGALLNGAAVIPLNISRTPPRAAAQWFAEVGATIYHSVPTIFRSIARTNVSIPTLRAIRLEGDASNRLDVELFNARFDRDCVLVNGLGATETGIVAQYVIHPGDVVDHGIVPIGQTTADMSVRIVDQEGRAVPPGDSGEIEVTSRYLAHGYWNKPELTRRSFQDAGDGRRRYRTGDLGVQRLDGVLEYRGRTDAKIRISGEWFDLALLEATLLAVPGVDNAVLSAATNGNGDPQLTAWVVADQPAEFTSQLIDTCRQRLFNACGRRIDINMVDALPLDSNGKVNRRNGHVAQQVSRPRTRTEKQVAQVFADVLNVPNIGVESDFFSLGGDSLAAVAASDAIDAKLGTTCALGLLQHAPVVGELARLIDTGGTNDVIVPLQLEGTRPPLYCVHAHMGHVFNLRLLATHFAPHTAFYGIQAIGLTEDHTPLETIGEMAATYVQAIRHHYPSGPYLVAGYCFGSLVAVEMARLLREQGAVVEFVALIDPDIPGYHATKRVTLDNLRNILRQPAGQLVRSAARRFQQIFEASPRARLRGQQTTSNSTLAPGQHTRVEQAIRSAHHNFHPSGCAGPVHVFSPLRWTQSAQAACEKWVGGEVHVIELNAPPQDMMRDPWARQLSDAICLQLEEVRRARR